MKVPSEYLVLHLGKSHLSATFDTGSVCVISKAERAKKVNSKFKLKLGLNFLLPVNHLVKHEKSL